MAQCPEMGYLRDWVTSNDESRYDLQAAGTLRLDVTHSNLVQRWHDIVFDINMTISAVKDKLYRHGGTPARHQELYLRRGGGDTIFLMDMNRTLGHYGAKNGMEIHIKDTDEFSMSKHGGLEDVSQVEKYVMSEEQYDKLHNSVRAHKRREAEKKAREAAARKAAGEDIEEAAAEEEPEEPLEAVLERIPLGSRCQVEPGSRRGEGAFVGPVAGARPALVARRHGFVAGRRVAVDVVPVADEVRVGEHHGVVRVAPRLVERERPVAVRVRLRGADARGRR